MVIRNPFLQNSACVGSLTYVLISHVVLKGRCICGAVFTILTLVNLPSSVSLHMLFELILLSESSFAPFTLQWLILSMNWKDMTTKNKWIWCFKVTVPTLMNLPTLMDITMLFELRRAMETFITDLTFVRKILSVDRYDVPLKVTWVGALMVTMRTLVCLMSLKQIQMALKFSLITKCLGTMLTFIWQIVTMLRLNVSFQIWLICTPEDTILTLIWLFTQYGFSYVSWVQKDVESPSHTQHKHEENSCCEQPVNVGLTVLVPQFHSHSICTCASSAPCLLI